MSLERWRDAWNRAIPGELQVEGHPNYEPVHVEGVTGVEGIVKYITKSPWHDANGEGIEESIDGAIEIDALLFAIAKMRRYSSAGTLKLLSRTRRNRT